MDEPDIAKILVEALQDERKAQATYRAIMDRFGPVRPFVNIVEAEARHVQALERQMRRQGLEVPPDPWAAARPEPPGSLEEALAQAIEAEVENIALYDRLIPLIRDEGVRHVLQNLQDASRDNHLEAFRRALLRERGDAPLAGSGRRGGGPGRAGSGRRRP